MLDYAAHKNIPVWTEYKLLEFLRSKEKTSFINLNWNDNQLSFDIRSTMKFPERLTCMIPYVHNENKLRNIGLDAKEIQYTVRKIKGIEYALFDITPGSSYHVKVTYSKPVN